MKTWKSWLVASLCLACILAAYAAPDWTADQSSNGYGYHPPHPPHPH